jgi:hypothetical protein
MNPLAGARAGRIARVVWALTLRYSNGRGELRLIFGSLALMLLFGMGAAVLHAHAQHATSWHAGRDARLHALLSTSLWRWLVGGLIGSFVYFGQILLAVNMPLQNAPNTARLVPGHVPSLRAAAFALWAASSGVLTACAALAAGPQGALFALMLSMVSAAWMLYGKAPRLMVLLAVAPSVALGSGLLRAAVEAGLVDPLVVTGLAVLAGACAAWFAIESGNSRHRLRFDAVNDALRNRGLQAHLGQVGPGRRLAWFMGPSRAWLRPIDTRASKPLDRLMLGFGPLLHWASLLKRTLWLSVLMLVLVAVQAVPHLIGYGGYDGFVRIAPVLWLGLIGGTLATPAIHRALIGTRAEQTLLRLLPTVPTGHALTQGICRRIVATALIPLGVVALLLIILAQIVPVWNIGSSAGWLICATALESLIPLSLLRDWSKADTSTVSVSGALFPMMAGLGASYFAAAWVLWLHQSPAALVLMAALLAALIVARSWRLSERWPVMIPVGRGTPVPGRGKA